MTGVIANGDNNSALAQAQNLSSPLVNWSQQLNQSAMNVLGVLKAWNEAKNPAGSSPQVPVGINAPVAQTIDTKIQKGFFYGGVALVFIAGGIFLYKSI